MKKMTTKKMVQIDALDDMEEIISCGFDLLNSIKRANWNYNNKTGLPHPTLHMENACSNWIRIINQFNRNLKEKKSCVFS